MGHLLEEGGTKKYNNNLRTTEALRTSWICTLSIFPSDFGVMMKRRIKIKIIFYSPQHILP